MTGSTSSSEAADDFYARLPVFDSFARLTDASIYTPLPDGWVIGLADIERSTAAIEAGRYKAVNTAAASVIAAVANALKGHDFPFVFGGDGASFAVARQAAATAQAALAAVAAWIRDDLDLPMRVALVPLNAIRSHGLDVRIARFAPSPNVSYAMFAGGGLAWGERQMKAGAFGVEPAPRGTPVDLSGLSCRFSEIATERGVVLSLIVVPGASGDEARFQKLVADILELAEGGAEVGRPMPAGGPGLRWPPEGLDLEARAVAARGRWRWAALLAVGLRSLGAHLVFRTGVPIGRFDPARYRRQLVENTDFRKFDDGLRMTLDCTPALADRLEATLADAERAGIARSGTHRQTSALMTCFVPAAMRSDHVHFVDGAMGGYAAAARTLKAASQS
jgi:hypothetical protein